MPSDREQKPGRTERAKENRAANSGGSAPQGESRAASIARAKAKRAAKESSGGSAISTTSGGDGARSRSVERIQERQQQRRRQQITIAAISAAVIIGLIALAVLVVNAPAEAPIPATAARYAELVQSRTEDGYPRLGDPRAPIQVGLYSSFDCTACQTFHENSMDELIDRVRAGSISVTFVPLSGTGSITNGRGAAVAAVCAAEQNDFWRMSDTLFSWTPIYGNQSFTNNRILTAVRDLGLDVGTFNGCVGGSSASETLTRAQNQSRDLTNFTGTPTITINGIVPLNDEGVPLTDPIDIFNELDARIEAVELRNETEATAEASAEPAAEVTAEATEAPVIEATAEPTAEATP